MSIFKQILGVFVVLLAVAGGYFAYERLAEGRTDATGQAAGPQAVPVRLASAELGPVRRNVEAVGSTRALRAIQVVPLVSGRIEAIEFEPGQRVSAGDPIVRLDDDIEQADLTEARAMLKEAQLALERAWKLRETNITTQATLEGLIAREATARAALDRARRRLADRVIRAPFDGIVGLRQVDVGARVDDTTVITTLDDLSAVELEFSLPETLYGAVKTGQPITARSAAFPEREFEGVIVDIDSRVDPVARAFKVRARLPNRDLTLPAGMFMLLSVVLDEREGVKIPEAAIVSEADQTFVYVADGERAVRTPVEIGQRQVGTVEIVRGLEAGQKVVVAGTQRLRDGTAIRVVGGADDAATEERDAAEPGRV